MKELKIKAEQHLRDSGLVPNSLMSQELVVERMVEFASEAVNSVLKEVGDKIEEGKNPQSILQCSKEVGLGAVTQVYFRKGANWVKEIVSSLQNNKL